MKYIPSEKLKELIDKKWKELANKNVKVGGGKWDAEISTYLSVLRLIDSLQQEQPEFNVGDLVVSKKNPHLTYKILATNIPNELGKSDYKVEIFTDGKPGLLSKPHNICLISSDKIEDWGELVQQEQPCDMKSPFTGGNVVICSKEEEVTFRGEKIKIVRQYYRCIDTGKEFTDSKLDEDMMWAAFRAYCEKKGVTSFTDIMLKQEQPEVDLDKEIIRYKVPFFDEREYLNETTFDAIARHFYELGFNTRK